MTRCIMVATFTVASLLTQQAQAWEALDNFIDDIVSCCSIDTGPPIDYGPPPAVYVPPPAPAPMVMAAPACAPPPSAAPACCPPPTCCDKMKACWQKSCNWWTSLCSKCCPGSKAGAAPNYQPPYVTPPGGTASMMYGEQPYSVAYPPYDGYESYSEGPSFGAGPMLDYGPATGTTSEVIPAPLNSI